MDGIALLPGPDDVCQRTRLFHYTGTSIAIDAATHYYGLGKVRLFNLTIDGRRKCGWGLAT
jgi:hypothetical protein